METPTLSELAGQMTTTEAQIATALLDRIGGVVEILSRVNAAVAALDRLDDVRALQLEQLELRVTRLEGAPVTDADHAELLELLRAYSGDSAA